MIIMTTNDCIKFEQIVELGIATADEIALVRRIISGSWNEVLDTIVHARTGYRDFEQYIRAEMEEE